jgi:ketosteroid isomerase-like protein
VDRVVGSSYLGGVRNALSERLVAGIAAQDEAAIAGCFADDAEFRALSPPGLRERSGAFEAASLIAAWFGDSTVLDLDHAQTTQIGDRLRISYRFTGIENGEPYVVEQHLFCTVRHGKIERADLLCSGFRPRH